MGIWEATHTFGEELEMHTANFEKVGTHEFCHIMHMHMLVARN